MDVSASLRRRADGSLTIRGEQRSSAKKSAGYLLHEGLRAG